jgi:hypothetical protein
MLVGAGVVGRPLSSAFRVEEFAWGRDPGAAKPPELEQVVVAGDDRVGSGGKSALENPVVGLILTHDAHRLLWMNENRELADCRSRLSHRVADQRNLRGRTPLISSRIAGEM